MTHIILLTYLIETFMTHGVNVFPVETPNHGVGSLFWFDSSIHSRRAAQMLPVRTNNILLAEFVSVFALCYIW